ncbi:MAG: Smr/MutS family protein [Pontibacterium sp.]
MSDPGKTNDNDQEQCFLDAMEDVIRHQHTGANLGRSKKHDINLSAKRAAATTDEDRVIDHLSSEAAPLVESNEELLFVSPGIQLRLIKRLKQGHIPWEAGLDLHGYTVDRAREELSRFIRDARRQQFRSVMVIHGKAYSQAGQQARLKSYVNEWLRRMPGVLAFCSAQARHGGAGALYVLLKKIN